MFLSGQRAAILLLPYLVGLCHYGKPKPMISNTEVTDQRM